MKVSEASHLADASTAFLFILSAVRFTSALLHEEDASLYFGPVKRATNNFFDV